MRRFKSLFLFTIAFAFSLFLFVLQLNIALKFTLLSPEFFGKLMEDKSVSNLIVESLEIPDSSKVYDESPWGMDELPPLKAIFLDSMNRTWLEGQMPLLAKGTHSYIINDSNTLPILDFKPVKQNLQNNAMKELDRVTQAYPSEKKQREREKLEGRLKLNNIKDELDMNKLIEELYQKYTNPLRAIREFVEVYNSKIFIPLFVVNALFVLIIFLTCLDLKLAYRWLAQGFFVGGLLGIFVGIQGTKGFLIGYIPGIPEDTREVSQLIKAVFFGEFHRIMLVQSVILLIIGIVLIILRVIASRKSKLYPTDCGVLMNNSSEVMVAKNDGERMRFAARIAIVFVLTAAIPVIMLFGFKTMKGSFNKMNESISNPDVEFKKLDFNAAMAAAAGTELLKEKFDPSNAVKDSTEGKLMSVLFEVVDNTGKTVSGVSLIINKDKPDGQKVDILNMTGTNGAVRFSRGAGKYFVKSSQNSLPQNLKMIKKPMEIEVKKDVENNFKLTLERK